MIGEYNTMIGDEEESKNADWVREARESNMEPKCREFDVAK